MGRTNGCCLTDRRVALVLDLDLEVDLRSNLSRKVRREDRPPDGPAEAGAPDVALRTRSKVHDHLAAVHDGVGVGREPAQPLLDTGRADLPQGRASEQLRLVRSDSEAPARPRTGCCPIACPRPTPRTASPGAASRSRGSRRRVCRAAYLRQRSRRTGRAGTRSRRAAPSRARRRTSRAARAPAPVPRRSAERSCTGRTGCSSRRR